MGLTKNGRKIFGALFSTSHSNYSGTTFSGMGLVNHEGETGSSAQLNSVSKTVVNSVGYDVITYCNLNTVVDGNRDTPLTYLGICLGSGNSPETSDDYNLTGTALSGRSVSFLRGGPAGMLSGTLVAYNGTSADITVREIGLGLWYSRYISSGYGYYGDNYLLYRKVLQSPVVVKPDETYSFTLVIR